jgi:hypothetical protein
MHEDNKIKTKLDDILTQTIKINMKVWKWCSLSPMLFNVYIQQITTKWKEEEIKGIQISRNKNIETHLFVDDQVIMADSEDALQISVCKLEMVTSKCGLKISASRMKTIAFK